MPTKPPIIVHYVHRPKRGRKKKAQPALQTRIVTIPSRRAKKKAEEPLVQVAQAAPLATIEAPRIVTAREPRRRFGDVPDMTPEEHQQRGDAAEALFRERLCGASENDATGGAATAIIRCLTALRPLAAPRRAFPSWYLRM